MKFTDDFDAFLRDNVNLNQTRLDRLETSVNAITEYVSGHTDLADLFIDVIPAGSWAHRSIIRPVDEVHEFDADVLLLVKEQPAWKAKDYINVLNQAFRESSVYKDKTRKKTRCVRIDYVGDFHIDVVPYLERSDSMYITNRCQPNEQTGRFELSKPEAFTAWVDERERLTNGTFIKVVRLVKYLRDFKGTFTCKSIILKTLVGELVTPSDVQAHPEWFTDVPSTLRTLMNKLATSLPATMPAVMDPAGTGDSFALRYGATWDYHNFRAKMIDYAGKIEYAYSETDRDASIRAWRKVFGDDFKAAYQTKSAELSEEIVRASVPYRGEQFIDQAPFGFRLSARMPYSARIHGRVTGYRAGATRRRNGFRMFDLAKSGNRVPKNRSIDFSVTTNVSAPYTVYWKVRNGGKEAAGAQCLRGEISSTGGCTKSETTLYAGSHYVEVYIVKDGVVVAKGRQQVIVSIS